MAEPYGIDRTAIATIAADWGTFAEALVGPPVGGNPDGLRPETALALRRLDHPLVNRFLTISDDWSSTSLANMLAVQAVSAAQA